MFTLLLLPFGLGFVLSVYAEIQMIRKAASVHVGWLLGTLATPVAATGFALFVLPRLQPAMANRSWTILGFVLLVPIGTIVFMMARWRAAKDHALSWIGGHVLLWFCAVVAMNTDFAGPRRHRTARAEPRALTRSVDTRPGRRARVPGPVERPSSATPTVPSGSMGSTGQLQGSLMITSNVSGAPVTLDGVAIGHAPMTRDGVEPGHHVVACLLPAFEPFAFELDLAPSDVVAVNLRLDPKGSAQPGGSGFLTVDDATPGRDVRVMGDVVGRTPFASAPVPAGLYDLEVVGADGAVVSQRVIVNTNETLRVTAAPPPAPRGRRR